MTLLLASWASLLNSSPYTPSRSPPPPCPLGGGIQDGYITIFHSPAADILFSLPRPDEVFILGGGLYLREGEPGRGHSPVR